MIERFRASGLGHLTAVSGQNVAFLLAAAGPLLRRARPSTRWVVDAGADRLVRRADPGRAVGAAGRGDGGAERDRVRARPPGASRCGCWPSPSSGCCCSTRCWRGRSASGCPSAPRPASRSAPPLAAAAAPARPAGPAGRRHPRRAGRGRAAQPARVRAALARRHGRQPRRRAGRRAGDARRAAGLPARRRRRRSWRRWSWRPSAGAWAGSTPSPPSPPAVEPAPPWSWLGWLCAGASAGRRVRSSPGSATAGCDDAPRWRCTC